MNGVRFVLSMAIISLILMPLGACDAASRATSPDTLVTSPDTPTRGALSSSPAAQAAKPASAPKTQAPPAAPPTQGRKFVAPIRGVAEIGYLRPVTKVVGNEVVTTIRIKNLSNAPIAGLRVDEFWWDAQGNPLPSDYEILKKPLMPGEVVEIELRVPKNPKMNRNQYQFRHANGQIKPKLLTKF